MQPKVLVITLECGEAEFKESQASVALQTGVEITHKIISNLPELEAHNAFLSLFESCKDDFDMFVKVDADTIIDHNTAFSVVHNQLLKTEAAAAQLLLYDYFTCSNIYGLNFYSPTKNTFTISTDKLYCDRSIRHHGRILYPDHFEEFKLTPVGRHCAYPTPQQAFHFGFHRGLKNRANEENRVLRCAVDNKTDTARTYAIIGFTLARKHRNMHHEYTSADFEALFSEAQEIFKALSVDWE